MISPTFTVFPWNILATNVLLFALYVKFLSYFRSLFPLALFAASQKTRPLLVVSVLLSVTYAFVAVAALPDVF